MPKQNQTKKEKKIECNHAMASHEGHGMIYFDEANKQNLSEECCGGAVIFKFCPFCGQNVHEWNKVILHGRKKQK